MPWSSSVVPLPHSHRGCLEWLIHGRCGWLLWAHTCLQWHASFLRPRFRKGLDSGDMQLGFIFSALLKIAEPCNYSLSTGISWSKQCSHRREEYMKSLTASSEFGMGFILPGIRHQWCRLLYIWPVDIFQVSREKCMKPDSPDLL